MSFARRCSIAVFVLPLAFAACGGSSKKVDPAADLALAKASVLTSADVPGYKGVAHTKSADPPAAVKKDFAACMKVPTTIFDDKPGQQKADSQDFSKGQSQISDSIAIDPKKSQIDDGFKQMSQQGAEPCLAKLFQAVLAQSASDHPGVTFSPPTVERFDPGVGDRSVGYAVKVSVTGGGASLVSYTDLVFVPRDRAGMNFSFTNVGVPFDRSVETGLAQMVYDRVGDKAK
jgi:hypothetical protein